MNRRTLLMNWVLPVAAIILLGSCGGSGISEGRYSFDLSLIGLPDSGLMRGHYQGWAVGGNGVARSTGTFIIQGAAATAVVSSPDGRRIYGTRAVSTFGPSSTLMGSSFPFVVDARWFFITLEPEGDHDGVPSCQILLAGAFVGNNVTLSTDAVATTAGVDCGVDIGGTTFLGLGDVAAASGSYVMGSPTDAAMMNDYAGVWFADALPPGAGAGLMLPLLPGTLVYEGWAKVDGVWQSTGRFTDPAARDHDASHALQRGNSGPGPEIPGQDFVFPFTPVFPNDPPQLDLTESVFFVDGDYRALVTIEPLMDNSRGPFSGPVLEKVIPIDGAVSGFGQLPTDMDVGAAANMAASVQTAVGSLTLQGITLPDWGAGATDRLGSYELFVSIAGVDSSVDRFVLDGINVHSLTAGVAIGTTTTVTFTAANTMNPSFPAVGTADSVFITFEPEADSDPLPSNARILEASSLLSGGGSLTFPAFDLTTAAGSFGLRSPSNNALGTPADDESGVSFMSDSLQPLLALPILTAGWTYEGWVEDRNTGRLFSTGRFQDPAAPDSDSMIDLARGAGFIPGFPSRDFVNAVPTLTLNAAFPGSITEIMVTIEATPDAEIGPSPMLLLSGVVPAGATGGGVAVQVNSLTNQVVTGASLNYSGTLSINR